MSVKLSLSSMLCEVLISRSMRDACASLATDATTPYGDSCLVQPRHRGGGCASRDLLSAYVVGRPLRAGTSLAAGGRIPVGGDSGHYLYRHHGAVDRRITRGRFDQHLLLLHRGPNRGGVRQGIGGSGAVCFSPQTV